MLTNFQILSTPAPMSNHINEDAWLALESAEPPGYSLAAVIDGASARVTIPQLETALKQHYHGISAAAFAALQVRQSLVDQFNRQPDLSLTSALLTANESLRDAIADLIGDFSPAHILTLVDQLRGGDPRRVRLALPACVVTLARMDYSRQEIEYAHAGDTALLEIRHDGNVICHTADQMGLYDQQTLRLAVHLREERALPHITDAVELPEVAQLNIENRLRHNYVDPQGRTHPGEGCGVINGLSELADYIESGIINIDPTQTAGFCLLSDGLQLLAPLEETPAQQQARLRQTGALLNTQGLPGLFVALQEMITADAHCDQYPRMKLQDDATGVYLHISDKP